MPNKPHLCLIAGSGPDAGLDLFHKVLVANKQQLGEAFRGDIDAPNMTLRSVPALGLSMDLEKYCEEVWGTLRDTLIEVAAYADVFCIACNTLHYFQERIEALQLRCRFISFVDVLRDYITTHRLSPVCLLGARQVLAMETWSPYRKLASQVQVEIPLWHDELHQLILDVKRLGADDPSVRDHFSALLSRISSNTVLLACTELPMIQVSTDKQLIDVTDLVAQELARVSTNF